MTVFEKLKAATETAQNEQDLPDFLAHQIFFIIEHQEKFRKVEAEITNLAEQVSMYDTYGQTGYMGMGVNNTVLEMALKRVMAKQPEKNPLQT